MLDFDPFTFHETLNFVHTQMNNTHDLLLLLITIFWTLFSLKTTPVEIASTWMSNHAPLPLIRWRHLLPACRTLWPYWMWFQGTFYQLLLYLTFIPLLKLQLQKLKFTVKLHSIKNLSKSNNKDTERKLRKFFTKFLNEKIWCHLGKQLFHRFLNNLPENLFD